MATIDIVVPRLDARRFSGGPWCVIQYADGLARAGHDVLVIPSLPSPLPTWFPSGHQFRYVAEAREITAGELRRRLLRSFSGAVRYVLRQGRKEEIQADLSEAVARLALLRPKVVPFEMFRAASTRYVRQCLREADATIATSFETAIPVALYGKREKFYFMQHFEALFWKEAAGKELSRSEAMLSYRLGLRMIANSSWLKEVITAAVPGADVRLCPNAINHEFFHGYPKEPTDSKVVKVISYGGRGVDWKGFKEMALAVQQARRRCTDVTIVWQVYGDAALPPDNAVAPYEALGFLGPAKLSDAYQQADILLSASWYESFPLFPLEAMACGIAVVTTAPGTEDYAVAGETAQVVKPRDIDDIASGLVRLIEDPAYRHRLAQSGQKRAQDFTWEASVRRMEELILEALARQPHDWDKHRDLGLFASGA